MLIGNAGGESRARELPPHSLAFARMVATELLPWLRERHPALTGEARRVIAAGSSYGGLGAAAGRGAGAQPLWLLLVGAAGAAACATCCKRAACP